MKQILFKLATVIISVGLIFLILEATLRFFTPPWLQQRMMILNPEAASNSFGSDTGWKVIRKDGAFIKFAPNSKMNVKHYEYNHKASINRWGGRWTQFCDVDKNQKTPFFGDSFTFGVGVKDNETFVNILGVSFQRCFLNLGVPGMGLEEEIALLKNRFEELGHPKKFIVSFFIGNDFKLEREYKTLTTVATQRETFKTFVEKTNRFFYHQPALKKIYTFQFFRAKALILYNRLRIRHGEPIVSDAVFQTLIKQNRDTLKEYLMDNLGKLSQLSHSLKSKPFFILIPDRHQVNLNYLSIKTKFYGLNLQEIDAEQPNRVLATALKSYKIPFIDVTTCLKKEALQKNLFYIQDNHLTSEGHRLVAKCVESELNKFMAMDESYE